MPLPFTKLLSSTVLTAGFVALSSVAASAYPQPGWTAQPFRPPADAVQPDLRQAQRPLPPPPDRNDGWNDRRDNIRDNVRDDVENCLSKDSHNERRRCFDHLQDRNNSFRPPDREFNDSARRPPSW